MVVKELLTWAAFGAMSLLLFVLSLTASEVGLKPMLTVGGVVLTAYIAVAMFLYVQYRRSAVVLTSALMRISIGPNHFEVERQQAPHWKTWSLREPRVKDGRVESRGALLKTFTHHPHFPSAALEDALGVVGLDPWTAALLTAEIHDTVVEYCERHKLGWEEESEAQGVPGTV